MPTKPVEYVNQPFVRGINAPDIRSLADMIRQRGDLYGQMAMTRSSAPTWMGLAAAFNQYQNLVQERQKQQAVLAQRQQEQAAAEQLKRDEMAQRQQERAETVQRQSVLDQRQTNRDAITDADRVANNTMPGVISSDMAEQMRPSGRVQVLDGVPVLARTPVQARQAAQDADARKTAESLASDRAADNTRADQQLAISRGQLQIAQQNANKRPVGKLAAGTADKVAMAQTSLSALDRLEGIYKDDFIGPVAGRYNQRERSLPSVPGMNLLPDAPQGFEEFAAETATLKNQVIQAITGAAVGVQEQGRIMAQIPDINDQPSQWKAKAKATRRNLQELMANQVRMGTGAEPLENGMSVEVNIPQTTPARVNPFRKPR